MEEMEGRPLRCEERNIRDGRRGGGWGTRSMYYGCRPASLGNGVEPDAGLLGNLRDAKPNMVLNRDDSMEGVELCLCSTLQLTRCL